MKKALVVGNTRSYIVDLMEKMGYEITYYNDCPKNILGMEFNMVWFNEWDVIRGECASEIID